MKEHTEGTQQPNAVVKALEWKMIQNACLNVSMMANN